MNFQLNVDKGMIAMGVTFFLFLYIFILIFSIIIFTIGLVSLIIFLKSRHYKMIIISVILIVVAVVIAIPKVKSLYAVFQAYIEQCQYSKTLVGEVKNDNYSAVKQLLQKGENPNSRAYNNGYTPLMCACYYDEQNFVNLLILYHADPNLVEEETEENYDTLDNNDIYSDKGYTALMIAVKYSEDLNIVKSLVNAGADINHVAADKQTPLTLAKRNEETAIYNYLEKNQ
jgi:hypothetical protein